VIADGCPYDEESQCTIRLDDNSVVCLRAVNRYLALVCQLPVQHYRYEGLIELEHILDSLHHFSDHLLSFDHVADTHYPDEPGLANC